MVLWIWPKLCAIQNIFLFAISQTQHNITFSTACCSLNKIKCVAIQSQSLFVQKANSFKMYSISLSVPFVAGFCISLDITKSYTFLMQCFGAAPRPEEAYKQSYLRDMRTERFSAVYFRTRCPPQPASRSSVNAPEGIYARFVFEIGTRVLLLAAFILKFNCLSLIGVSWALGGYFE